MLLIFLLIILLFRFNSDQILITRGADFLLFGTFFLTFMIKKMKIDRRVLIYFLLTCIFMTFSILNGTNHVEFNPRNLFEFFRPLYYFLILVVFMNLLSKKDVLSIDDLSDSKYRSVDKLFKLYLLVQMCFIFYQKISPSGFLNNYIGVLYSTEKLSVGLGRVVGMSGNPNTLAICISLVMFYFLSKAVVESDSRRIVFVALVNIVLVFLTTSRFVLLMLLFIYFVIFIFKLSLRFRVLVSIIIAMVFFQTINIVMDNLYYRELIIHFINLDFYSIPSVYNRVELYKSIFLVVKDSPVFAYGPNKDFSNVGDNIYLFLYFQWGWVGMLFQLLPLLFLLFSSYKHKSEQSFRLFISTFFLFSCGLVYESFYNLIYMPIYLFFIADFLLVYKRDCDENFARGKKYTQQI